MASSLSILRSVLHITAAIILTLSIAFSLSSVFTTGWQRYYDSGTQEIHQHGLWFDYTFAKRHVAGHPDPDWSWRYKFGTAVDGDEQHRWKPYQYNTLILITTAAFLGFVSVVLSYMAPFFVGVAIVWAFVSLWPAFLAAAGVVVFFTTASLPEHNRVYTDKNIMLEIGYSFYFAVAAAAGFAIAMALILGAAIVDVTLLRRGERPSLRETYFKVRGGGGAAEGAATSKSATVTTKTVTTHVEQKLLVEGPQSTTV